MRLRTTLKIMVIVALAAFLYGGYLFNEDRWGQKWQPANAVLPDNVKYYGELKNGLLEGPGELIGADGRHFKGSFHQGLMHGEGELSGADYVYRGQFERGMFNGHGILEFSLGDRYEGKFLDNRMHGKGKMQYRDGATFEGEFAADRMIHGTFKDEFGTYEGDFVDDLYQGKGVYESLSGDRYEGQFLKGDLVGNAKIDLSDGSHYEGEVENWIYSGKGVLADGDGNIYSGDFKNGLYHGQGELKLAQPINGVNAISGIWNHGFLKEDPRYAHEDHSTLVENILYSQSELLGRSAAGVVAGDPAKIEYYYLGIAGDGSQNIFLRELQFVSTLLEEKLGVAKHQILLANNPSSTDVFPLATRTSVKAALAAIAQKMNVEQDILVMYLTSHGSDDHVFHIAMPGLELPGIGKTELASVLEESGIRWRIVIISACYAGGFIPELQNENTLVITAAREDRRSFGCDDDNDMTYFARAYFKESFAKTPEWIAAFESAKTLVNDWEYRDFPDDEHSEPQMFVGEKIKNHLKLAAGSERTP